MKNMTVGELKEKLETKENLLLLDVREFNELSMASVVGAHHVPMMQIPLKYQEFEKNKPIAVMCHTGGRSAQVCMFLDQFGFDTYNVLGGIHAWSLEIDSSVPTY